MLIQRKWFTIKKVIKNTPQGWRIPPLQYNDDRKFFCFADFNFSKSCWMPFFQMSFEVVSFTLLSSSSTLCSVSNLFAYFLAKNILLKPQCRNLANFLPDWFYVKSILADFRRSKPFWWLWILILLIILKFMASFYSKWQFLTLKNCHKSQLIRRKIWVTVKSWNFHTV